MPSALPEHIATEAELDEALTRPSPALVDFTRRLAGPLIVLGAGGKMGPTLCVLARRASEAAGRPLEVVAASRFGSAGARGWLEARGVRTVPCDLLDPDQVRRLPDAPDVVYLVGLKFGTSANPALTWAVNTLVPAQVAARYPSARIVALSTGNVYPPSRVSAGGAVEADPLTPVGEYANAAVGRERIFQFESARRGARIALIRLFYACELRYGVLADIARKVASGEAIDLTAGHFNAIWQGDANDMILRALDLASAPPSLWNLCRPETFSTRDVSVAFGRLLGREPHFRGIESDTALVGTAAALTAALGCPPTHLGTMVRWVARWITAGGRDLGKPTHFETRDGNY